MQTYGLTREQAVAMVDGACQACGTHADSKNMHVDHDHVTGAVRGLLCHGCNTTLGLLNEDVERIRALIAYVERHDPLAETADRCAKEQHDREEA